MLGWVRVQRETATRLDQGDSTMIQSQQQELKFLSPALFGVGADPACQSRIGWSRQSGSRERERRLTSTVVGRQKGLDWATEHNMAYLYYTHVTMTPPFKKWALYSISVTVFYAINGSRSVFVCLFFVCLFCFLFWFCFCFCFCFFFCLIQFILMSPSNPERLIYPCPHTFVDWSYELFTVL